MVYTYAGAEIKCLCCQSNWSEMMVSIWTWKTTSWDYCSLLVNWSVLTFTLLLSMICEIYHTYTAKVYMHSILFYYLDRGHTKSYFVYSHVVILTLSSSPCNTIVKGQLAGAGHWNKICILLIMQKHLRIATSCDAWYQWT